MNVTVTGPFVYFTIPIFGGIPITQTTVSGWIVTVLLCTAFVRLGKGLKKRPDDSQILVEKGYMMVHHMVVETMGAHNAHWTPFVITVFLSSICGSLIGLTGFLRSTTADVSTTITWALLVSVIIWYNSIKSNGFVGWLRGFSEPVAVMTPMNIVSEIAQPISMAFRHFGNVAGGGVITGILYAALGMASSLVLDLVGGSGTLVAVIVLSLGVGLIFLWTRNKKNIALVFGVIFAVLGFFGLLQALNILTDVPILALGIPAVLSLYFDFFSGFVQAFVFSLLTMVYISGALPEPEEANQNHHRNNI